MKTINHYEVEIITKDGLIYKIGNRFYLTKIEVLAENTHRYCLNNEQFTRLEKNNSHYSDTINKPSIRSSVDDTCWGTGVRYTLYTTATKRKSTIKREIENYIAKKYGGFSNIDLSFLDNPA